MTTADPSLRTKPKPREKRMGRPPNDPSSRKYYDGELHALIARKMPCLVRGGRVNVAEISRRTGNAKFTIYRWLAADRISTEAAKKLRDMSRAAVHDGEAKEEITPEDLLPFLIS